MVLRGDEEPRFTDSILPVSLLLTYADRQVVSLRISPCERLFVQGPNTGEPSVPSRKGRVTSFFSFFFFSPVPFHGRESKSRRLLKTESGGRVSLLRVKTDVCVRVGTGEGKREYTGAQQICGE